jgi:hypothetical protein
VEIGFKGRISNNQQGMSNVQLRKRFALLVEHLSKWQDTFLGYWKLGTGYWIFVFQPPLRGLPDASRSAGGASRWRNRRKRGFWVGCLRKFEIKVILSGNEDLSTTRYKSAYRKKGVKPKHDYCKNTP